MMLMRSSKCSLMVLFRGLNQNEYNDIAFSLLTVASKDNIEMCNEMWQLCAQVSEF